MNCSWSGGGEFLTRTLERLFTAGETVIHLLLRIYKFFGTVKPASYVALHLKLTLQLRSRTRVENHPPFRLTFIIKFIIGSLDTVLNRSTCFKMVPPPSKAGSKFNNFFLLTLIFYKAYFI